MLVAHPCKTLGGPSPALVTLLTMWAARPPTAICRLSGRWPPAANAASPWSCLLPLVYGYAHTPRWRFGYSWSEPLGWACCAQASGLSAGPAAAASSPRCNARQAAAPAGGRGGGLHATCVLSWCVACAAAVRAGRRLGLCLGGSGAPPCGCDGHVSRAERGVGRVDHVENESNGHGFGRPRTCVVKCNVQAPCISRHSFSGAIAAADLISNAAESSRQGCCRENCLGRGLIDESLETSRADDDGELPLEAGLPPGRAGAGRHLAALGWNATPLPRLPRSTLGCIYPRSQSLLIAAAADPHRRPTPEPCTSPRRL